MPRTSPVISLTEAARKPLEQWVAAHGTPQQVALRCRIVLAAAAGETNLQIAAAWQGDVKTVALWRRRFAQTGPEGLWEIACGRGRKPTYSARKIKAIIPATLLRKPDGMTQWSCRQMAQAQGVSKSTVSTICRSHNLKPHRVKSFKLSRDARFMEKLTDVVGLYLNPPDQALVLCVDEKTQIQALDRTQPGLPMKKGRLGTMTHDYKRNGTTCLFAALELLQGKVVGQCFTRHRHQEFLKFLRRLDAEFPGDIALHLVMDNYGTHKHPNVQLWLKRHPRFVAHFVPTSSSWLNLVERWFGELTAKAVRRGSFGSVADLQSAIAQFLDAWNECPKPFLWTATVESIQAKLSRCRQTLEQIKPGCTAPRMRNSRDVGPRFHDMSARDFTPCRSSVLWHVGPVREAGQPRLPWSLFQGKGDRRWPKRGCPCARFEKYYGCGPKGLASGRLPGAWPVRAPACRFACGGPSRPGSAGRCLRSWTMRGWMRCSIRGGQRASRCIRRRILRGSSAN